MAKMTRRRAQQEAQMKEEEEAQAKAQQEQGQESEEPESAEQDPDKQADGENERDLEQGEEPKEIYAAMNRTEKGSGSSLESTAQNGGELHTFDASIHDADDGRDGMGPGLDSKDLLSLNHSTILNPSEDDQNNSDGIHLNLDRTPPTDLLSPLSAAPNPSFFNNDPHHQHPLQSHPDLVPHHEPQLHLSSPHSDDNLDHHRNQSHQSHQSYHTSSSSPNSHHSFQQSSQNDSLQQPQTRQFFSDPFHHNAHLDTHSPDNQSPHLEQHRPSSSSGGVANGDQNQGHGYLPGHHLGGGNRHVHHMSAPGTYLPPPVPLQHQLNQGFGAFPQYMHRASISGPIPTHGIYPPPHANALQQNHSNAPPHADQMAAWANAAGGARPHTADGMFGHFGGFPGPAWASLGSGMDYRGPRASTGSISGSVAASPPPHQRIFSHMSAGEEADHLHQQHSQHQPHPYRLERSNSVASTSGVPLRGGDDQNEDDHRSLEQGQDGDQSHQIHDGGNPVKKRPRRRYDEIERLYTCGWQGCVKSYGTLNHLNAHVSMQKHGEKRSPAEFKEMRRAWRKGKREEESRRQQALAKANEDAIMRAKIAAHFDLNMGGSGGEGSTSNFSIPSGMAPPPLTNAHTVYSPPSHAPYAAHAHPHPHPQGSNMHHPFSVPSHSAHPPPPPMAAPQQTYQGQMNRYSFGSPSNPPNGIGNGDESFSRDETNIQQSQSSSYAPNESRPFTSAGLHQHPVAYLLAHRGSI